MHFIHSIWDHCEEIGVHYRVNPIIFGALYVAHHPLFWGTMACLAHRARSRKNLSVQLIFAVFFWTMPYAYVLLFGRGLPWWAYVIAAIFLLVGGRHAVVEIRQKILAARESPAATP